MNHLGPLGLYLSLALCLGGCPAATRAPDVREAGAKPDLISMALRVEGAQLLYTFFDNRAEMITVDRPQDVALEARAEVMVTNPRALLPGNLVQLVDLTKPRKDGTFRAWGDERSAWLDRVMPQKSVLDKITAEQLALASKQPAAGQATLPPPPPDKRPRRRKAKKKPQAPVQQTKDQVYLFSTDWCPACRSARAYFKQRGIAYEELNVQNDAQAAKEYMALQRRFRFKEGTVPVIVVNGRVLAGVSPRQIEAALAAGPPPG